MKSISVSLDLMLVIRKVKSKDLAKAIGITEQGLSKLKQNHAKGIRFSTLGKICEYLECQPGDLLKYDED